MKHHSSFKVEVTSQHSLKRTEAICCIYLWHDERLLQTSVNDIDGCPSTFATYCFVWANFTLRRVDHVVLLPGVVVPLSCYRASTSFMLS
jgi:hypothetical protein